MEVQLLIQRLLLLIRLNVFRVVVKARKGQLPLQYQPLRHPFQSLHPFQLLHHLAVIVHIKMRKVGITGVNSKINLKRETILLGIVKIVESYMLWVEVKVYMLLFLQT